jgi:hypothetical protein
VAAALGACARNGDDPARIATNATANPVIPRLRASLKFPIAVLRLVRTGIGVGHTFGASAGSLTGS